MKSLKKTRLEIYVPIKSPGDIDYLHYPDVRSWVEQELAYLHGGQTTLEGSGLYFHYPTARLLADNIAIIYSDLDLDLTNRRHRRVFEAYIQGLLNFISNQLAAEVETLIAYHPVAHASI